MESAVCHDGEGKAAGAGSGWSHGQEAEKEGCRCSACFLLRVQPGTPAEDPSQGVDPH